LGQNRSPEEYQAGELDEAIDVYSFGNCLYSLLTGLWVFYENEDDAIVQEKVLTGKRPMIDIRYRNRSLEEKILVEVIEGCWQPDPKKRLDIFQVVRRLRENSQSL
jgi:serine/threonine protein kinase